MLTGVLNNKERGPGLRVKVKNFLNLSLSLNLNFLE